jgi:hypothetical protein
VRTYVYYHLPPCLSGWAPYPSHNQSCYIICSKLLFVSHCLLIFQFVKLSEESHIWDSYSNVAQDILQSHFFLISTQKYSTSCTFWGHGLSVHTLTTIFYKCEKNGCFFTYFCIITKYLFHLVHVITVLFCFLFLLHVFEEKMRKKELWSCCLNRMINTSFYENGIKICSCATIIISSIILVDVLA